MKDKVYEVSEYVEGYNVWHIQADSAEEAMQVVEEGGADDADFAVKHSEALEAEEISEEQAWRLGFY